MFQFDTVTPNIQTVVAVNPKEYVCVYRHEVKNTLKSVDKHKGIPRKIRLSYEDYSQCFRSLEYLDEHHDAIKSGTMSYCRMGPVKGRYAMVDMKKVSLGALTDKVYIFTNGVMTLPHGHVALASIYAAALGKTGLELQSNEHIERLRVLKRDIVAAHPRLLLLQQFYEMNEHIYTAEEFLS